MRKVKLLAFLTLLLLTAGCTRAVDSAPTDFSRVEQLPRFEAGDPPRFHADRAPEFIPMDYGEIFPFLGQLNQGRFMTFERFGFIDREGRIICDPIFNTVEILAHGDRHVFVVAKTWIIDEVDMASYMWGGDIETFGYTAIISSDGSFYSEFDEVYMSWYTRRLDLELIPVMRDGKWGAIDFDGNLRVDFVFPNAPLFAYGLAAVYDWADDETYFYINEQGERVLGPYQRASSMLFYGNMHSGAYPMVFDNGLARHFHNDRMGFINTEGQLVIGHQFMPPDDFFQPRWNEAGRMFVALPETTRIPNQWGGHDIGYTHVMIDTQGNRIVTSPPTHISALHSGQGVYIVMDMDWNEAAAFDLYGNELPVFGHSHIGGGYFISRLADVNGHRLVGNDIDLVFEGQFVSRIFGDWFTVHDTDTETRYALNVQTNEINDDFIERSWAEASDPHHHIVVHFCYSTRETRVGVVDNDANIIIDIVFDSLRSIGENYFATQGRYGGLLNAQGDWLIRVRLAGNYD